MAKQGKNRPLTGEPRKTKRPLSIDLLPMDVLESIKELRGKWGFSWLEIERLSSLPFDPKWRSQIGTHGFVNWDALPTPVLNRFPDLKLPQINLHRWYDLRVEQAQKEVLAQAEQARVIAAAFAKAGVDGSNEAVLNATRDVIFQLLQNSDTKSQVTVSKLLLVLGEVMNGAKANAIKERKVVVEERRLIQLEKDAELKRRRMEQETERAAKKISKGEFGIDDLNIIRSRTFGLPPISAKS